jgi:Txe/YoeB family toxin of Txe-Axe toxin-antitoxin module
MNWIRQLMQVEPLRIDAKNHQLYEIRNRAMRYANDSAQHLRDLIAAALLLRALTTDPDDYSGLKILVQTDDPDRFSKRIDAKDRVVVENIRTRARAGLRLGRLKPEFIALVRERVECFIPLPKGSPRGTVEVPLSEIARLRKEAATLLDEVGPSKVFKRDQTLCRGTQAGRSSAYA